MQGQDGPEHQEQMVLQDHIFENTRHQGMRHRMQENWVSAPAVTWSLWVMHETRFLSAAMTVIL